MKMASDAEAMRALRKIVEEYGLDFWNILENYLAGNVGPEALQVQFEAIAYSAHKNAHLLGQEVLDEGRPILGLASDRGRLLSIGELSYFRGFVSSLMSRDKRYFDDDGPRLPQIARRVESYLPKAEGSANAGFLAQAPLAAQVDWLLGAKDHCDLCPIMADSGPYYRETLPFLPREYMTPCRQYCACQIQVNEKAAFDPVEYELVQALGLAA